MKEKLIVKMKFGSHLYGTSTELSDTDYKGVFMPTKEQIYLNRIPRTYKYSTKKEDNVKNTPEDIEFEIFSLHYFIDLACEGQTVALDMLHAPANMIIFNSKIWEKLVNNRKLFYTKNINAFVGYARKQAAKYGIKGSRLNDTKKVLDFLKQFDNETRMKDLWNRLPSGEHISMTINKRTKLEEYEVCGRKIQPTAKIGFAVGIFERYYKNYGKRAELAAKNEGIDWKAVSHAIRAGLQVKEILTENNITFPLREAEYIKKVKVGELDYLTEVAPKLETLMDEIELLSKESSLPVNVNRSYWDDFLMEIIDEYI